MLYNTTKITAWCIETHKKLRTTQLQHATKYSNLGKHKSSATNLAIALSKNQKKYTGQKHNLKLKHYYQNRCM